MLRACRYVDVRRQRLYQRRQRQTRQAQRADQVRALVPAERGRLPRLGPRKLGHKSGPPLRAQGLRCGRDALLALLRGRPLRVVPKRRFPNTTDAHQRFGKPPNQGKDAPPLTAPHPRWVSDIPSLPTAQGTG